jgi:hypothetical protein
MSENSAKHANPMPINAAATLVARLGHLVGIMANFGGEFSMGSQIYAGSDRIININRTGAHVLRCNEVSHQIDASGHELPRRP